MKRIVSLFLAFALCLTTFLLSLPATASDAYYSGFLYKYGNSTHMMVPTRGVFQSMGAGVIWNDKTKTVTITKGNTRILLKVGSTSATVNGETRKMPVPAIVKDGTLYLPLRFVSEIIGNSKVVWDEQNSTAIIPYNGSKIYVKATNTPAKSASRGVSNNQNNSNTTASNISGIKTFTTKINNIKVTGVKIPLSLYKPKMVVANDRLGTVESLYSMAKRNNAVVAVNGTFFNAYGGQPDPWGTIIKNGVPIHIGHVGTVFGFTADGKVKMERLRIEIKGGAGGSFDYPNNWYSCGFNHAPGNNGVYIYTREWGEKLGFAEGTSIVVENGTVKEIKKNEDVIIPQNGYVINLTGTEEYMLRAFEVGKSVEYKVIYTDPDGDELDWSDVVEGLGAGPTLVKNGKISVNPTAEGFSSPKILNMSCVRSAIGVTKDGYVIIITVPSATINQLAQIMYELGCYNAMNLDGGASSGLYYNGQYLTKPGRDLSNALIFLPR